MEFNGEELEFHGTTQVKEGVVCEVYTFKNDTSRDLGIVTVSKGCKTPLQKVMGGDKTIEIYKSGSGKLIITKTDGRQETYVYPGDVLEVGVSIGELMQWEATDNLVFFEICYPPYTDGRFESRIDGLHG